MFLCKIFKTINLFFVCIYVCVFIAVSLTKDNTVYYKIRSFNNEIPVNLVSVVYSIVVSGLLFHCFNVYETNYIVEQHFRPKFFNPLKWIGTFLLDSTTFSAILLIHGVEQIDSIFLILYSMATISILSYFNDYYYDDIKTLKPHYFALPFALCTVMYIFFKFKTLILEQSIMIATSIAALQIFVPFVIQWLYLKYIHRNREKVSCETNDEADIFLEIQDNHAKKAVLFEAVIYANSCASALIISWAIINLARKHLTLEDIVRST